MPHPVVYANKARCRDCYRCVRVCPVKAIRVSDGQAQVDEARCIACGTCIRECPQGAKCFRHDLEQAMLLLRSGARVGASLAPSFAAFFPEWRCLPAALRMLGFAWVGETASGAYPVAQRTAEWVAAHPGQAHLCTACPAVVSYVERYRPACRSRLVPVVSPMIAHARQLRAHLGPDSKVVFIGPCVAKKAEAQRPELAGEVDCVLTFAELREGFELAGIKLAACEPANFDDTPGGAARHFPMAGGLLKTAHLSTDPLAPKIVAISGIDDLNALLDDLQQGEQDVLVEPLFCAQGCINGPAGGPAPNVYRRREALLHYAAQEGPEAPVTESLPARFETPAQESEEFSEAQIRAVLERTGKAEPENQLNCGACGYPSCRDNAVAVLRGLAEPEMCIPHMRRLAEQRADRIMETSPNGIVILDKRLHILSVNPAFRKLFMCSEAICGKPISYLMDPDPFEKVASHQTPRFEGVTRHEQYHLVCHQIVYEIPGDEQYVGIFMNITTARKSQEELDRLRHQTLRQARELLEHQVSMAQRMAEFLGESTAKGEDLAEKLMELAQDEEGRDPSGEGGPSDWLRRIYTSR